MLTASGGLSYAWRRLAAAPAFSIFAVLTLSLGIGAATASYSIIRAVLAPPSGIRDFHEIVNVYHVAHGSVPMIALSWPDYNDFKARQTVFESVTAWTFSRQTITANGRTETSFGELVGGEYFHVLRVGIVLGRPLQPGDDLASSPPVAVISHRTWQRMFDGSPDVVGRVARINGQAFEIVGVAAESFRGLFNGGLVPSAAWIPIAAARLLPREGSAVSFDPNDRERRWMLVKGRLRPGRSLADAQIEVTAIASALDAVFPIGRNVEPRLRMPYRNSRPWNVRFASDILVNESADRLVRPLVVTLMTAVGLVLLVACTNLANLMIARGSARRHEFAVRVALGASRRRILQEAGAESVILVGAGSLISLVVARGLLIAIGNDLSVGNGAVLRVEPAIDDVGLITTAGASALAMVVAGLIPAWQSTRMSVRAALAAQESTVAPRWRGRRVLITMQVSVSFVLLAIAGLCLNQVRHQGKRDSGLDLHQIAFVQVDFAQQRYDTPRARGIVNAVLAHVRNHPRVAAVAASSGLPFGVQTPGGSVRSPDGGSAVRVEALASTPDIFKVLGVSVLRGRALDVRDTKDARPVVVLSESAARAVLGTTDILGRQLVFKRAQWAGMPAPHDEPVTVVGIAADTDTGSLGRRDHGAAYLSLDQHFEGRLVLVARTAVDTAALVGILRTTLHSVDRDVGVVQAGTGATIAGDASLFLRVTGGLSTLLGGFALVIALAGLYGALSHIVGCRSREIGIRLTLGATRRQVMWLVVADGLRPVVSGVIIGFVVGTVVRMALRSWFVRSFPSIDVFVLAIAPLSLLAAAVVACYLPARRAARVDPNVALRDL